jgi:FkbM family methyltransferase
MSEQKEFAVALLEEIVQGVYTQETHNTDVDRFGPPTLSARIKDELKSLLFRQGLFVSNPSTSEVYKNNVSALSGRLEGFESFYHSLANQTSRELLVKLIAFRILGKDRLRLPLNSDEFWRRRESIKSLFDETDTLKAGGDWILKRADLNATGYPISLYCLGGGLYNTFELKQYEYQGCSPPIKAERGDVVIDAGGCWGDTALYFAHEAGDTGKVYAFEFVPTNLAVMRKNLTLNRELSSRVAVIEKPLWDKSDQTLYFTDNGPASRVSFTKTSEQYLSTISIDDFVSRNNVSRIDFIKMDIEGAELNALKGAAAVISRCKPKLAISVYHDLSDFVTVPEFISSLNLGYRFYLGHYTIHAEETVLFATVAD